jgi:hypothetical protein
MNDKTTGNESNSIWGDPFQALIDHFEAHDINYSSNSEERRAWFTMNSGSALQKCSFRFDSTGDALQIYIQYPVLVKEKFRMAAMEFITRANYGLVIGNFEMDVKDGEIRYHVSHLMENGQLTDETIRRLFGTAMGTSERYFPALMKVLFAGEIPQEAIDLVELDKFDDEATTSQLPSGCQGPSSVKSRKKTRAKRSRKSSSSTPQAPRAENQDDVTNGTEGEDRKAA